MIKEISIKDLSKIKNVEMSTINYHIKKGRFKTVDRNGKNLVALNSDNIKTLINEQISNIDLKNFINELINDYDELEKKYKKLHNKQG